MDLHPTLPPKGGTTNGRDMNGSTDHHFTFSARP